MKPISFVGSSLDDIRSFPEGVRRAAGFQLEKVQRGREPDDWKPMKAIGVGVRKIRLREQKGAYQ
jgi:phage-related protein